MRLAQLARKLQVRPSEIVDFLSNQGITTEEGFNARLEDSQVALIAGQFAPSLLSEIMKEAEPEPTLAPAPIDVPEPLKEEPRLVMEEQLSAMEERTDLSSDDKNDIIKAPKIDLPGLKVLGKIELPEAKKKEEQKKEEDPLLSDKQPEVKPNRGARQDRRNSRPRRDEPWRNPVALQREREAKEAEEKRQQQLKKEKELRTLRYQKKVSKMTQPTKAAKLIDEPTEEVVVADNPPAKTWFGKFFRWLRAS